MARRQISKADKGATAIEYALIAALIALSAFAAMQGVGARIIATLTLIADVFGVGVGGTGPSPGP
jgi:Flp pilus assembly pilin Flp